MRRINSTLQRGRARAGAECAPVAAGLATGGFNGAAPARARNGDEQYKQKLRRCFNGAAPARARNECYGNPIHVLKASTGPRPRGRGMVRRGRLTSSRRRGFNGAAPARARNATASRHRAQARQSASTGPRPRGRGMYAVTGNVRRHFAMLQRGRARAGAECHDLQFRPIARPDRASTGPRPRGRGMSECQRAAECVH